jgi:hypothetical protein
MCCRPEFIEDAGVVGSSLRVMLSRPGAGKTDAEAT